MKPKHELLIIGSVLRGHIDCHCQQYISPENLAIPGLLAHIFTFYVLYQIYYTFASNQYRYALRLRFLCIHKTHTYFCFRKIHEIF